MNVLKIRGDYEGYVSVFAKLDSDFIKNVEKLEEKYQRIEAAEESFDMLFFLMGSMWNKYLL